MRIGFRVVSPLTLARLAVDKRRSFMGLVCFMAAKLATGWVDSGRLFSFLAAHSATEMVGLGG